MTKSCSSNGHAYSVVGQSPPPNHLSDLAQNALARLCADMRHKPTPAQTAHATLGDPCVAAMAYALCDPDDASFSILVSELLDAGLSVEELYLGHLAPAARRLGEMWDRDRLPFSEVTLATARIQAKMRRMPAVRIAPYCGSGKGAVFAAVPGEEHTIGVMMAADLFRRSGWDVDLLIGLSHDELVTRISRDDRPVIGLSCSGDHSYPALCRLLLALKHTRPDATVLLSGQLADDPERVANLPASVTVVSDIAAAEAEMIKIEAPLAAARQDQLQRWSGSAA